MAFGDLPGFGQATRNLPGDPLAATHLPPQLLNLLGQQPNNPFGGIPSTPGTQAEHFDRLISNTAANPGIAKAATDIPLELAGLLPPQAGQTFGTTPNSLTGSPGTLSNGLNNQNGGFDMSSLLGLLGQGPQQRPAFGGQQFGGFGGFGRSSFFGGQGTGRQTFF